jgi:hypothetical protein
MKPSEILSNALKTVSARLSFPTVVMAVLAGLMSLTWGVAAGRAQPPKYDAPGAQVLTRGPVHEAFAGMVTFNPEPGVTVSKRPPDVIEEVPPAERPEGDNVAWIPGYWGWDDERSDFVWVSGTWRALPPGREWIAGYWGQSGQGHQWISGYWADAAVRETLYLPAPPATVEAGPNIAAPSYDYIWMPGNWFWYQGRYAWRPGYWTQAQPAWDWIPAHYIWTPRGYIFVEGYWDYPVERRGILFAPVYFERSVYSRRGYSYSPMIVINLGVFSDHLFLRPRYHHYYFGDYYAPGYAQAGYYASYSYQSSRYGYDPFYSRQRWVHRQDRDWANRVEVSFQYRRDNVAARPPRTWAAQSSISTAPATSAQTRMVAAAVVATPIDQLARNKDSPVRFQAVAAAERQQIVQRRQEVQTSREQRNTLEARAEVTTVRTPTAVAEPVKVQLPRSPIVAKPASQLGKGHAPPTVPQSPSPDLKTAPRVEPARQAGVERSSPQPAPRALESERNSPPRRGEVNARENQAQQEAEQRAREAARAQEEAQRNARAQAQRAQPGPDRSAQEAPGRSAEDPQRNAPGKGKGKQKQPEPNANAAAAARAAQEEALRKAKELEDAQRQSAPPVTSDSPPPQPTKRGPEHPGKGKGPP